MGARTKWVEAEGPAIVARKLFERIHALWTTMQREGDRIGLVLADGMLDVAEQILNTGPEKVELHRALLRLVPSIEGR